jgi:hypothetical protein
MPPDRVEGRLAAADTTSVGLSSAQAELLEPVSPELALVDPELRERLLAELRRVHDPAPGHLSRLELDQVRVPARLSQRRAPPNRSGRVLAGLALAVGIAIGVVTELPHHSGAKSKWFPTFAASTAAKTQPALRVSPPVASPVVAVVESSHTG